MPKLRKKLEKANVLACNEFVIGSTEANNNQSSHAIEGALSPEILPYGDPTDCSENATQLKPILLAPTSGTTTPNQGKIKNKLGWKAATGAPSVKAISANFPPIGKTGEKWTNQKKTLIGLDWLELKLEVGHLSLEAFNQKGTCTFVKGSEFYSLELLPFGGKTYRTGAAVYYGNSKMGTVHFDSIFENLSKTAKLQLENTVFYDDFAEITLHSIISNFVKAIGSKILSVLRADIALDCPQFGAFARSVDQMQIVPIRASSMKGGNCAYNYSNFERECTGFSYGSRSSGRLIRCYDKSREITEKSQHKTYILDYWKANGLNDVKGNIWRLEYELKTDFLKTVCGFEWSHLFDKKRLLALTEVATKSFFEWVPADALRNAPNAHQRQKRLQRAEKITVIDFDQVQTENYQRIKAKAKPKTDRTVKIMIKQLSLSAALTAENDLEKALNYAKVAGLLMEQNDLQSYVVRKTHFWKPQIEREAWRQGRAVNPMIDLPNLATSLVELQNMYV
ncbi:hypothetical protein [Haliscomenobacter sp.]|uniref:hypothetical protein n=1 Tax=Haliscomenobacter sp. TaxID=2717303 RepID=UPI003BAC1D90